MKALVLMFKKKYVKVRKSLNWTIRHSTSFREYKSRVRKEKWESVKWVNESLKDMSEVARLRKILAKEPTDPNRIRRLDNSWTFRKIIGTKFRKIAIILALRRIMHWVRVFFIFSFLKALFPQCCYLSYRVHAEENTVGFKILSLMVTK